MTGLQARPLSNRTSVGPQLLSYAMPRLSRRALLAEISDPGIGHLFPFPVGRSLRAIVIVPVPPLIRRALRVTLGRVLPNLLPPERRNVEVAPDGSHCLVAAPVDEIGAEDLPAIAKEHVVTVVFVHAEVHIEAVGDGVPGHLPVHTRLETRDVRLRRTRGIRQGGIASVQVREVAHLIRAQRAATAGVVRPTEHPGFEESPINDQLPPTLEQIEQAGLAAGTLELIRLLDRHPRHAPTFGGKSVSCTHMSLFLHEDLP